MTGPTEPKKWGGSRAGAGRPSTGRKKYNIYVTPAEYELLLDQFVQIRANTFRYSGQVVFCIDYADAFRFCFS